SSPAAAVATLETRHEALAKEEEDADFRLFVFESAEDRTDDEPPVPPVEGAEATLADAERRRLRELDKLAKALINSPGDTKLTRCAELVSALLQDGFHPIVWCRYIATADYLAERLQKTLQRSFPHLRVVSITGRFGDDERRAMIDDLVQQP